MGNQQGRMIDPVLLGLEITYIKTRQLCSPELKSTIDTDIQIMLTSINKPNAGQSIEGGTLEPEIKEILLDRINEYRLSDKVDERFFDPQVMSMINCLYGNLLTVDRELFAASQPTKDYFRLTENLSSGNWGIVFKARNSGSRMNFIIKTQLNPDLTDMSIHEVFAALKAINPLRTFCPNFSVLYGGFVCGKPDGISGKLCGGNVDVPYTIYEAVPGDTLFKTLTALQDNQERETKLEEFVDKSYAEILSSLLQLYFSLKTAHRQAFNFSHRDLHVENVIMRPLKKEMLIRYRSQVMDRIQSIPALDIDYYVRCNHVATIIDYDTCELYLPVNYGPDDNRTERFGRRDNDPVGRPLSGDPNLSHLRDLAKILGFTAYVGLKSRANNLFKILLADIFLQTMQPSLLDKHLVVNYAANPMNTKLELRDYPELIGRERGTYFQLSHGQVRLSRQGTLHFDNFLEVFMRLVPQNYLNHILAIDNQPANLADINADKVAVELLEKRMGVEVLGCKTGQCPSEVETYRHIINPQDEAKRAAADFLEPENLAHHVATVDKAILRMDNNFRSGFKPVRIAPQANNPNLTVQYRDVLVAELILAEAEVSEAKAREMGYRLADMMLKMRVMLADFILPVHQEFNQINARTGLGVQKYREAINKTFRVIAAAREATIVNDVLVALNPNIAKTYSGDMVKHVDAINAFLTNVFAPWKNELIRLVASNFFGDKTPDISRLILSKMV